METSAMPGKTPARYPRIGIFSRRQVSTMEAMAATFGPASLLPTWIQFFRLSKYFARPELCSLPDYVQSAGFRLAGQPGEARICRAGTRNLDKANWCRPTVHNQSVCRNSRTRSVGRYRDCLMFGG